MKKRYLVLFFFSFVLTQAQNTYENTKISVLTIGPGTSLNDAFGHNGIRVKTPYSDVVYDYGRFPFNDPNFYLNFARGKLLYSQGFSNTYAVIDFYKSQNRTIREQLLDLTTKEKQDIHAFLETNALPANKEYLYDFFYDNCATKIRDVAEEITNNNIRFNPIETLHKSTFRDLIQQNLYWNSWGSLGIDLALGSIIDKEATQYQYMFLPKYIHSFFETATLKSTNKNLVKESHILYNKTEEKQQQNFFGSPIFIFGLLGAFILFITYTDHKKETRSKWLDFSIFFLTGSIGVFILLLWFATDHTATANNYNLLWAFALNVLVIGQTLKAQPKAWFIKYMKLLIILLSLLGFHWITGVQRFAYGLIPLLIALAIRYIYLVRFFSKSNS
ncbi:MULTISPECIES: lipoprotein N-acyltransferase Lnb domain-containing protein [unclassified Lacinutrix]